jgi:hypothetical protein
MTTKILFAVFLVLALVLVTVCISHIRDCGECKGKVGGAFWLPWKHVAEPLVGTGTRIFRGVGVANLADERQLGGGIITSQPLFDMTHTYFDGREMVSCDECTNPVLCQGCPNMQEVAALYDMEPRGRMGAGRTPVVGTGTHTRSSALSEHFDGESANNTSKNTRRHVPATARGLIGGAAGSATTVAPLGALAFGTSPLSWGGNNGGVAARTSARSPDPAEFVGLNNYQYRLA